MITGVSPCGERPIFDRFVEKSPVTVIIRALMEVVLAEPKLDELFEKTAQTGYTKELLFSSLVKMMTQVVCSVRFLYWLGLQSHGARKLAYRKPPFMTSSIA